MVVVGKFEDSAGTGLSRQRAGIFMEGLLTMVFGEGRWCCAC